MMTLDRARRIQQWVREGVSYPTIAEYCAMLDRHDEQARTEVIGSTLEEFGRAQVEMARKTLEQEKQL